MEARSSSSDIEPGRPRNGALEAILPSSISVAATGADIPDAKLFPEEAVAVAHAVETRRLEFATARACARVALAGRGVRQAAIPAGPHGEPLWPAGIVGSITHCDGCRACAVAGEGEFLALGIDAEPNCPLSERTLAAIACREERALVRRLSEARPGISWDRLLFSAKESVFKAWFPLIRRRLGFDDVRIDFHPGGESFSAHPRASGSLVADPRRGLLTGRWKLDRDLLFTAVYRTAL